jgi:hypothetical protein
MAGEAQTTARLGVTHSPAAVGTQRDACSRAAMARGRGAKKPCASPSNGRPASQWFTQARAAGEQLRDEGTDNGPCWDVVVVMSELLVRAVAAEV